MEKVRDDFDHIKAALDEMLYYNPEELERQANEYEREMARKEGREEVVKEGAKNTLKYIVFSMYNSNYSLEDISNITKLSFLDVTNILDDKKQFIIHLFAKELTI